MAWLPPEEETGYDGSAVLLLGERAIDVVVHLDGHLEPLDGLFHWYGRIDVGSAAVAAAKDAGRRPARLVIGGGAPCPAVRLAEYDPWGHVQVTGTGAAAVLRSSAVEVDLARA